MLLVKAAKSEYLGRILCLVKRGQGLRKVSTAESRQEVLLRDKLKPMCAVRLNGLPLHPVQPVTQDRMIHLLINL